MSFLDGFFDDFPIVSENADAKKGDWPRCGGPDRGLCEAGNCLDGTIAGYQSEAVRGAKNCPKIFECKAYKKHIKILSSKAKRRS